MSAVKRSLNVGVAGMGNMGIAIVRNLAFKARSAMYIQIHSRTLSKARKVCDDLGVDGATCAMRIHDRYRTLTKWCDVILLTLANRSAARHVLLEDAEALLPHARPGQIIVDHTTVDVELSRECAHVAQSRGAVFLDVPMSGSPRAAFNGQLVLMAGGPRDSFQRMLPIFRLYADTIHHMGECGSGSATKLLSQALVAAHNAAAAEAMTIANRLGIEDHSKLVQVLDASWGSSTMLRRNAPTMQDLIRSPDKVPPTSGASVDRLLDDLSLLDASLAEARYFAVHGHKRPVDVTQAAESSRAKGHSDSADGDTRHDWMFDRNDEGEDEEQFPVLDAALRMHGAASEAGMGSKDMSTVVHYIQAAAAMEREDRRNKRAQLAPLSMGSPSVTALPLMQSVLPDRANECVGETGQGAIAPDESYEFGTEDFY